jgi:cell wall-associated NlpC family hydrolase
MASDLWTPERLELLAAELKAWEGTPHVNRVAVRGQGVDCVRLVCQVLVAAGIIESPTLPFYDERLGVLRARNIIEDVLLTHLHGTRHEPAEAQDGDIVVCRCGRQTNHVGIFYRGDMWHAPGKGRVGPEPWATWEARTQSLVRLHAVGYKVPPGTLTWDAIRALAGGQ